VALKIARELIVQKLVGQEQVLRKFFKEPPSLDVIAAARRSVANANTNDEIRRWEAKGALAYWGTMREMPVNFSQADSLRIPEHWLRFGGRVSPLTNSPRLAVNPANAILNYLYAVLESESRLALAALGLDPGLGVLHNDLRSRDSLAADLMEPARPKADALLLSLLTSEQLRREWFFEQRDGNCRLMASFAARLSETAPMWRTAVGSFAEWIARCLWASRMRPMRMRIDAPPTSLTQSHRSEGRTQRIGKNEDEILLRRPGMCRVCRHIRMLHDNICDDCSSASS
jgi:CRISPR/Cas system-associated endonuclease Cas1